MTSRNICKALRKATIKRLERLKYVSDSSFAIIATSDVIKLKSPRKGKINKEYENSDIKLSHPFEGFDVFLFYQA